MNGQSMKRIIGLGAALALLAPPARAVLLTNSADYVWTGLGATGVWNDPENWTGGPEGGFPGAADDDAGGPGDNVVDGSDGAIFPDGAGDVAITSGYASYRTRFNKLATGTGKVTLPDSWLPRRAGVVASPTGRRDATAAIGSGGLTVLGGGAISSLHAATQGSLRPFSSAGEVTGSSLYFGSTPVQTGGEWNVPLLYLAGGGDNQIGAWRIVNGADTLITPGPNNDGHHTFAASPEISGGRPTWSFPDASGDGGSNARLNLQHFLLYGDLLKLDTRRTAAADFHRGQIMVGNGCTVDVNRVEIALKGTTFFGRGAYMALTNATVYLRGSGTAWDNRSTNHERFDLRAGTAVTFASPGGTLSVNTGSKDRDSAARDPADWAGNFAFDKVFIAAGATVTLTGDANIEGGGNTALYATSMTGLGAGATVDLNGRNVYLLKNAHNITFTGAGKVYQQPRGTTVLVR